MDAIEACVVCQHYPFFKVKMCANGEKCKFIIRCNFAHSLAELRKPDTPLESTQYAFFKTNMCRNGPSCEFEERCHFAHHPGELREITKAVSSALAELESGSGITELPVTFKEVETNAYLEQLIEKQGPSKAILLDMMRSTAPYPMFKTKMCNKNPDCQHKARCLYAHSVDELRVFGEGISMALDPTRYPLFKTSMCFSFPDCSMGDLCQFAHSKEELRVVTLPSVLGEVEDTARVAKSGSVRYKSHMCKTFAKEGWCCYGGECSFAHGDAELRPIVCREYPNCKFGAKCKFSHGTKNAPKLAASTPEATTVVPEFAVSSDFAAEVDWVDTVSLDLILSQWNVDTVYAMFRKFKFPTLGLLAKFIDGPELMRRYAAPDVEENFMAPFPFGFGFNKLLFRGRFRSEMERLLQIDALASQ